MRVFLSEPNRKYDLTALKAYGPIEHVVQGHINPFNVQETILKLEEGFKKFNSTEDFLCLTGNLLSVSLTLMVAYSLFDSFRVLVFDARTSNYRERIVTHV